MSVSRHTNGRRPKESKNSPSAGNVGQPRKNGQTPWNRTWKEGKSVLIIRSSAAIFETTKATRTSSPRTRATSHAPTPAVQPLSPVIAVSTAGEWHLFDVSSLFVRVANKRCFVSFVQEPSWLRKHICNKTIWNLSGTWVIIRFPLFQSLSALAVNSPVNTRMKGVQVKLRACTCGAVGLSRSRKFSIESITLEKQLTLWRIPNMNITALKYCTLTYY